MDLDETARESAEKATELLREGQPINPWLMEIDLNTNVESPKSVKLHLGIPILIFELQQCGAQVDRGSILAFVLDDLKKHQREALSGYLTIVRHVVNPPPRRKSLGWFARMFTKPPPWTPPSPKWKWTSVGDVNLTGETLVVKGVCCDTE